MGQINNNGVVTSTSDDLLVKANKRTDDPSGRMVPMVTHATNALPLGAPRAIYVLTAGNLVMSFAGQDADVTMAVDAKTWHPISPSHVRAASSATALLAY